MGSQAVHFLKHSDLKVSPFKLNVKGGQVKMIGGPPSLLPILGMHTSTPHHLCHAENGLVDVGVS